MFLFGYDGNEYALPVEIEYPVRSALLNAFLTVMKYHNLLAYPVLVLLGVIISAMGVYVSVEYVIAHLIGYFSKR